MQTPFLQVCRMPNFACIILVYVTNSMQKLTFPAPPPPHLSGRHALLSMEFKASSSSATSWLLTVCQYGHVNHYCVATGWLPVWLSMISVLLSPVVFWLSASMVIWTFIVLPVVESPYGCQWSLFCCHQLTSESASMVMWILIVLPLVDFWPCGCQWSLFCCHQLTSDRLSAWSC